MRKPGMVTLLAAALALLLCGDTGTADAAAVPVAGDDPRAFVPMWLRGRYFLDNDGNKLYNATKDKPLGKQILTLGRLVRSTAFFPIAKTKTDGGYSRFDCLVLLVLYTVEMSRFAGNGVFDFRFTATPDGTFQVRNSKDSAVSTFDWWVDH